MLVERRFFKERKHTRKWKRLAGWELVFPIKVH